MKKLIVSLILMFAIPAYASVSATDTKRQFFTANGVSTTYTFTMPVNSEDDIRVEKRVTSTGTTTALTRGVDYTIASTGGDYLNGGVVTIAPALAATYEVIIIREIVQTQETTSGAINAISLEAALDKLTREVQDLRNDFDQRAVKLPESDATTLTSTLGNSVASAGLSIGRDSSGNITETAQAETTVSFSNFGLDWVALANALAARGVLELDTTDPVEFAAIVGTTGTYSGVITANDGVTLGAGDDLIGSATSDITMNTDKFTVAGDTGNTVVGGTFTSTGVATIADASLLATSAAPTTDAMIANKKYVDDSVATYMIDGVPTDVFTKYLTGTLDGDPSTTVAHGVASGATKILAVNGSMFNSTNSQWWAPGVGITSASIAANGGTIQWDDSNIEFDLVGTNFQGQAYKVKIDYIL